MLNVRLQKELYKIRRQYKGKRLKRLLQLIEADAAIVRESLPEGCKVGFDSKIAEMKALLTPNT